MHLCAAGVLLINPLANSLAFEIRTPNMYPLSLVPSIGLGYLRIYPMDQWSPAPIFPRHSMPSPQLRAVTVATSSSIYDRETIDAAVKAVTSQQQLDSTGSNNSTAMAPSSLSIPSPQFWAVPVANSSSIYDQETCKAAEIAYLSNISHTPLPNCCRLPAPPELLDIPPLAADMKVDQNGKLTCCMKLCGIKFSPGQIYKHFRDYHPLDGVRIVHCRLPLGKNTHHHDLVMPKDFPLHLLLVHYQRESTHCLLCRHRFSSYGACVHYWEKFHKEQTDRLALEARK
ncbi:hypothetical protein ARMGADRAFT_1080216 [Armillaria gallica]|uniref:C2H2-type domain-containing protein n=1 Tax=Armillaria gallica TaxID=47427 RepID=A0A2H3DXJ5_ARMGA|nr:hypothetical protein ARMGADRAFT_1080216 [Armillaria gallica]